ncbi:spermine/spermidine synthase domain-containing protein [Streptosporangium jomthongense]|uniref:Polyamine aminopropyltransferase n=1 Tax=Streptosporangium jomthongense TaxID=1193683 RepID=A0ABV8FBX0_9ACTN
MTDGRWSFEEIAPGEAHRHRIVAEVHSTRSAFQHIQVLETESYGRGLFLDGRIQHVAADEYIYSESMVHPAMFLLGGSCERALCIGAGPGGVVRELLRYPGVGEVVQVEIDTSVIDVARDHLPHVGTEHWSDPRVRLRIADVLEYLDDEPGRFDLIVNDLSEPLPGSPASEVFSARSVGLMRSRLSERGLYVSWCGSVGPRSSEMAARIGAVVERVFPHAYRYVTHPQSYGTVWMTVIGSNLPLDPLGTGAAEIDRHLAERMTGTLRLYDGITHHHMFHVPKDVREAVAGVDLEQPIQLLVDGSART